MHFQKKILIYIPCYNCEDQIVKTISEIPSSLHNQIECLVIDNQSDDRTVEYVLNEIKIKKHPFKIHLIRPTKNLGYAGSQKLAYHIASQSNKVKYVVMLHGDGQYSPSIVTRLTAEINKNYAIVHGFRDRKTYPVLEETPLSNYMIIKVLDWIENRLTGMSFKEWHSGFVMYNIEFIKKIPLHKLSNHRHIDGEFLICAHILGVPTCAVPIYKKYKEHERLSLSIRIRHVFNTFKVIGKVWYRHYHHILENGEPHYIDYQFETLSAKSI